jgi:pimeloyl-ACP methyl ester carboxylesterase
MLKAILTAVLLFFLTSVFAQSTTTLIDTAYNLNFELATKGDSSLPNKWVKFSLGKGYKYHTTTAEKHSGERSLLIEQTEEAGKGPFVSIANIIPAKYIGKEIEFKAYLKFENVTGFVAIFIRIDNGNRESVMFQSLQQQHIKGTKDWQLYNVKCTIPADAQTIFVSPILFGPGKLWVDDAQVLIDNKDISEAILKPNYNPHPVIRPTYGKNTAASGTVKLSNAKLYYETYGSGQPLLLLHGNSQSIYAFNFQIGELSKKYKVIAVDTRGQGKSTDETTGPLSYDLFADDMKQLLDSLHLKKVNILGWSDGGNTGLIMAEKYPEYVNKLAVMGANLFPTNEALPDTVLNQVKDGLEIYKKLTDARSQMEVRLFTMLLTEPHLTFNDVKKIKAPVLVMAGEHDLILEKHSKAIAAAIPHSKLVIFKGATHYAPVEIPAEFNAAVLKFFAE